MIYFDPRRTTYTQAQFATLQPNLERVLIGRYRRRCEQVPWPFSPRWAGLTVHYNSASRRGTPLGPWEQYLHVNEAHARLCVAHRGRPGRPPVIDRPFGRPALFCSSWNIHLRGTTGNGWGIDLAAAQKFQLTQMFPHRLSNALMHTLQADLQHLDAAGKPVPWRYFDVW